MESIREHKCRLCRELKGLIEELEPWYEVDKIVGDVVYIWTKDDPDNEEEPFGRNVFDIWDDRIIYFDEGHVIPTEAWPIIEKIQETLGAMDGWDAPMWKFKNA